MPDLRELDRLQAENADLRRRLGEAEETIDAIRSGAVDAVLVEEQHGERVYTLESADRPYRLFFEQMQQGAATLLADGAIVYCNARLADLLQTTREKLIGAPLREFLSPADAHRYDQLLLQGRSCSAQGEVALLRANGESAPTFLTLNPLPEDCGAAVGALVTDLTEQKLYERLQQSEERLQAALRAAKAATWDYDISTHHARWCRQMYDLYQRDPAQPPPPLDEFAAWIHPDDRDRAIAEMKHAAGHDGPFAVEFRVIRPDNRECWIRSSGVVSNGHAWGLDQDITERKQAEEQLRASEQQYRATFDNAAIGIAHVGLEGRWLQFNDAMCRITGFTRDELLARTFADVTHPDDVEPDWQEARRLLAGEISSYGMEKRYIRPDGEITWVYLTVSLMRSESGAPLHFISVIEDINPRKRSETELARTTEVLEKLLTNVPLGFCHLDRELRFLRINDQMAEMNGVPAENHLGKTVAEVVPSLFPTVQEITGRILATGLPVIGHEFSGETPAQPGVTRYWSECWYPVQDAGGAITGFGVIVEEITDRKRAEAEREGTQQTLAAVIERCPFGIYIVDDEFRIRSMNARSQDKAFANVRPLIGRPFDEAMRILWPEPDATECINIFRHTLDTGEPYFSRDFVNPRADIGLTEGYEWELYRITLPSGRYGVVCYYFDATQLREIEQQLKDADRRKDEFLATLAHELRNPLAPLRSSLEVMRLVGDNAPQSTECRSIMERQLQYMTRIVDDLLDLSRISRGKIVLQKTRLSLQVALDSALETSRPLIDERQHQLVLRLTDDPLWVDGDETRLAQVFANLLNNSAKYTDRGGRITVTLQRQESEAIVTVEDSGVGISPEMLPRVFEMFTQIDRSLERSQGGLGIGLNIVKRLVEKHGGTIAAHSDGQGHGSRFTVRLPLVSCEACTGNSAAETTDALARPQRRVLVVDDNEDAAKMLSMLLRVMGNDVRIAHDGQEGIEVAEQFRPDVILMDIGMPQLNGHDACRRIREQPWGRDIVIAALTGWGQEDDRKKSTDAGFDRHLTKPVTPADLETLLRAASESAAQPAAP